MASIILSSTIVLLFSNSINFDGKSMEREPSYSPVDIERVFQVLQDVDVASSASSLGAILPQRPEMKKS